MYFAIMITLGPFRISEVDKLKGIMDAKGAVHDFFADEDMKERVLSEHNEVATFSRDAAGKLDLRYIFIEIDEKEFEKVASEFEKLAIMKPSDGSWELSEED